MVDDGRTTDGRTTKHGYTISSPCEPDGSGELKSQYIPYHRFMFTLKSLTIKEADLIIGARNFISDVDLALVVEDLTECLYS